MITIKNILWDKKLLENIFLSIEEISDIEFQKKIWNGEIPNMVSSYIDATCSLFDDSFFDIFIDDYLKTTKVSEKFIQEINLLRDKLNTFDGSNMKHKKIFKHPQWLEISDIAKNVLELWKENELHRPNSEIKLFTVIVIYCTILQRAVVRKQTRNYLQ